MKTDEEARLFLELYLKQISRNSDGSYTKLDIGHLTLEWNTYIIGKLDISPNPQYVLAKLRFKTQQQLSAFKDLLEKKFASRVAIAPFLEDVRMLQCALWQTDTCHLPAIDGTTFTSY